MTGAEIMTAVGFFIMVFGFIFGFWKYLDSKLVAARTEASANLASVRNEASIGISAASATASLARQELAEHKLHSAETFVTKAGMQEQTNQIMRSIEGIGDKIDKVNDRIDRWVENQGKAAATRRA